MELQEDNVPPTALTDKEDLEDQAGGNNNNLPTQVSVDELELLRKLEEANRFVVVDGGGGDDDDDDGNVNIIVNICQHYFNTLQ